MNPFLNPIIIVKTLKSYLLDPSRTKRLTSEQLKHYQDKTFKKIVKYAYNVPIYNEIYKKAGIHPDDIKGIKDIEKLPFITKNDLRNNFPDRIIPLDYNKKKGFVISFTVLFSMLPRGRPLRVGIIRFEEPRKELFMILSTFPQRRGLS